MPLLEAVATYLASVGEGTVKTSSPQTGTPWLIYKGGAVPGDNADAITLSETPGNAPIDEMGATVGAVVAEEPGLQVIARHLDYSQARAKAESLWGKLHKLGETVLSGTRYLYVRAQQSPFPIGRDSSNRWMVGFNAIVSKERG